MDSEPRFKFSNILGGVYSGGNTVFSKDSKCLLSPVGNRVSIIDLTGTRMLISGFECQHDIVCMDISPINDSLFVVCDSAGCILTCSLLHNRILSTTRVRCSPVAVKFSPDGTKVLVLLADVAIVYQAPLVVERSLHELELICATTVSAGNSLLGQVSWSPNSKFYLTSCTDGAIRIVPFTPDLGFLISTIVGTGHNSIGAFFDNAQLLSLITVSKSGRLCRYSSQASVSDLNDLIERISIASTDETELVELDPDDPKFGISPSKRYFIKYIQEAKVMLSSLFEEKQFMNVTRCDFHVNVGLLAVGTENGYFALVQCPEFQLIHTISISDGALTSVRFNCNGDWIAMACDERCQLLVWDWQAEMWVLKQQSHFNNAAQCAAFSCDSTQIATGGKDGRLKVWSATTGSCLATLTNHKSEITGIVYKSSASPVVVTCSNDGSVRAFDLVRYRNFRTMTTPRPCQLSCIAIDHNGDMIAAGGHTEFEIYLWSLKTGQLLEALTGHTGPISSVKFLPNESFKLASTSWDTTLRTWDVMESKCPNEAILLLTEGLCVACNPLVSSELCVSLLNATILFFNHNDGKQIGSIDAKRDIGVSRKQGQVPTSLKLSFGRAFRSLEYTPDGQYLIAGGKTNFICIYHVEQKMLASRITLTKNQSIPGLHEMLDSRRMTEWGMKMSNAESDMKAEDIEADEPGRISDNIKLPGTKQLSKSGRVVDREMEVSCIAICPTGRNLLACTSEGMSLYSADNTNLFDPFDLDANATPESVQNDLEQGLYKSALEKVLRLNQKALISQVIHATPLEAVNLVINGQTEIVWIKRLLKFFASAIATTSSVELYLQWIQQLLTCQLLSLRAHSQEIRSTLCELERNLLCRTQPVSHALETASKSTAYYHRMNQLTARFAATDDLEKVADMRIE